MIQPVDLPYLSSLFPELASTPSAVVDALNDVGLLFVEETVFNKAARYALALVIAHQIKLDELRGGGAITAKKVGEISISQAALAAPQSGNWGLTSYGQRFEDLARSFSVPMRFVPPGGATLAPPFSFVASTARHRQSY